MAHRCHSGVSLRQLGRRQHRLEPAVVALLPQVERWAGLGPTELPGFVRIPRGRVAEWMLCFIAPVSVATRSKFVVEGGQTSGGTASTFHSMHEAGQSDRSAARQRRRLKNRNTRLGADGSADFARSERATLLVWRDWLAYCPEDHLRKRAQEMDTTANSILENIDVRERSVLVVALPRIRLRVDEVARRWATIDIEGSMCIPWAPVPVPSKRSAARAR
jgi:hypothetical protein